MKFLVLFSACMAAASAVELVTYPSGAVAPAKTPEVIAAEAAHFAAKGVYAGYPYGYAGWNGYYNGAWGAYNGWNGYYGYPHGALVAYANGGVAPVAPVVAAHPYAYAAGYPYAVAGLVAHPNGAVVPVEPADVVAAREEHLAAHAAA